MWLSFMLLMVLSISSSYAKKTASTIDRQRERITICVNFLKSSAEIDQSLRQCCMKFSTEAQSLSEISPAAFANPVTGGVCCTTMAETLTRPTLLMRIKDPADQQAWEEFVDIYTPMLFGYCVKRGLQEADAADVVQDVMRSISGAIERFDYDREKGKFRSCLFTVAHSKLCNHFAKRARQPKPLSDTMMMGLIDGQPSEEEERDWDLAYKKRLFEWAANRVKAKVASQTWQAFWRVTIEEDSVDSVAQELAMSPGAIYVAKSRTIVALKRELAEIIGEGEELNVDVA
ncbi:MAG: RNA polymerase sigma-70 factor (ECF subfamily) [Verrucomicrobiales bacterium]|jgi:RNA polymerase sigma-70 factor (ECF subfamily)